jgi:hypothetical protein
MRTGFKVQRLFFDRSAVFDRADRATRKVLSRFGAYVRRTAKGSIRFRHKASDPGKPPNSHTTLLRRFIFFSYEPMERSVVIGPARLNQKVGNAPEALEYGGPSTDLVGLRRERRRRTVYIRPRPYMGPAFEKEKPNLPGMWQDSIQ